MIRRSLAAPAFAAAALLVFVAGLATAVAQSVLPAGVQRVTAIEGVTEYRMDNGLTILLVPDATKPSTTVNVTYRVGSRHENYGETGMAHLLEHLLFKGTPSLPRLDQEMRARGMRNNATTSVDRTNYFETFTASDDNLDWALRMEADRMVNSFVARKDLDSEMTVVRNEMEQGENNAGRVLYQRMLGAAHDWHNYGKSTIGARADVENVRIERLQAFYRRYYQPDNAVVIVGGRFDPGRVLATVADAFGRIARPPRELEATYTLESAQDGERQVTLRRVGDVQYVGALYHAVAAGHRDHAPLQVLAEILGGTPSGRLHKALVETRKAASASGFVRTTREPGHMVFFVAVGKNDPLDPVRQLLLDSLEGAARAPITEEELKRVQVQSEQESAQLLSSTEALVSALSEAVGQGDWRLAFQARDAIAAVKVADVERVATAYLRPANRTLGQFVPTDSIARAPSPEPVDLAAVLGGYTGRAAVEQGEAFDPTPANIEARTRRVRLPNGMQLVLVPKKTRGATVNLRINLHFGDEKSLFGRVQAGTLAGAMLMRGTTRRDRARISDDLDRLKAQASVSGGAEGATAVARTTRAELAPTIALLAEILRMPAFPESEFEQMKAQSITGIEASRREPASIAGQALGRHFNRHPPGDVRHAATFDESIAAIRGTTLDAVRGFHRDFYGASNAIAAVVGDFDPAEVEALMGAAFGDWVSPQPYTRVGRQYVEAEGKAFTFRTPDKANAFAAGAASVALADSDTDAWATLLAGYLLGGSPTSRLWMRIREKDGLSYDVRMQLRLSNYEQASSWSVSAIYAPQNRDRVEAAFNEEVARALRDGFTDEEVAAAKKDMLEQRKLSRADDGGLATSLASLAHRGRTILFFAENDGRIEALTRAGIDAALRRHFDPSRLALVWAGDFKTP